MPNNKKLDEFFGNTGPTVTDIYNKEGSWENVRLGDVISFRNGERPKIVENGDFPVYGANGIMGYTDSFLADNDFTLIVGRVGASGEVHIAQGKIWISDNAIYSENYRREKVYMPLLYYLLKFQGLRRFATKTTHPIITQTFLKSLRIPLPPLEEQRRIAGFLGLVDEAIGLVDRVIAGTERLKKGLMQQLLTKGVNLFLLEREKIIDCVKRCFERGDHEFGREENLSHHLAECLKKKFPDYDVDVEVEKTDRLRPDIIIHKRHTNQNLFAIEVKKTLRDAGEAVRKLEEIMLGNYGYSEAIFIGFNITDFDSAFKLSNNVNFIFVNSKGEIKIKIREREYKQTEIGKIPKEWEIVKLENVIIEVKPGFASGKRDERGIIQLRVDSVTTEGWVNPQGYVKVPIPKNVEEYFLKPGDILFNNTNSADLIGKTAIFRGEIPECTYSNHLTRIRVKHDKVIPEWILYIFIKYWQQGIFRSMRHQHVQQAGIGRKALLNIKIPLPTLQEQQQIIMALSTIDKKLKLEKWRREKLERLKRGLMDLLLTGKIRLKEV